MLIASDEVHPCERALTSLKYFCEDAPDYHIIAAGSLLDVAVSRTMRHTQDTILASCLNNISKYKNIIWYNPVRIHSFREVLPVKDKKYVLETKEQPGIDKLDCKDFQINFQRAILLSLLENHKLTQAQYEACMDKVVQKYSENRRNTP